LLVERRISEADWKRLGRLKPVALDRFCQRVLAELARMAADPTKRSHDRYVAAFRLLQARDAELGSAFDDVRRSTALFRLARMRALDVVTDEELAGFDGETRQAVAALLGAPLAGPGAAADRAGSGR
jgi:hypothetical protein